MPKKARSKTRNSKSNNISNNSVMIDEHSRDLNGTTSLETVDSPSCPNNNDISKKRPAEISDDANDSNSEDVGPPRKKRNGQELKKSPNKNLKRPLNSLEDDCQQTRTKTPKLDSIDEPKSGYLKRIWKKSVSSSDNSQNYSENLSHFVIATYNILLDQHAYFFKSQSKSNLMGNLNLKVKHDQLMQELDFISADILCLQQVNLSYWKHNLECSLKERGFCGDIVTSDKDGNVGVATLYQNSRFVKVDIDSNKLSKLCVDQISSNGGMDEMTLNSIKQYIDEPDSYMLTVLRDKQMKDGRLLIVGNTHLSNVAVEKQDLRCLQAVGIFWRIHDMISQIKSDTAKKISGPGPHPHSVAPCWILCGDFNSMPNSPVYQICRDGYPNEQSIVELQSHRQVSVGGNAGQSSSLLDLMWHSFQHPLADSSSSYRKVLSHESTKNYIWMSEADLQPSKVLLPCCSSEYHQQSCTPPFVSNNNGSSSDHMSLACDVAFMT